MGRIEIVSSQRVYALGVPGAENKPLTARERYKLTMCQDIISVNKIESGETILPQVYVEFCKENENGETEDLLSILGYDIDKNEVVWCTKSPTFKRSFFDIMDIITDSHADGDTGEFYIRKIEGKSKSDREYVDCMLV